MNIKINMISDDEQNIYLDMFKVIILLVLVAGALSFQFEHPEISQPFLLTGGSQLGFPDYSGSCVTEDMKDKIIQIVNQASQYQGDDIEDNLRYIKQQVDIRFGSLQDDFYVHIQDKDQSGFFNVLTSDKCTVLGLEAGTNQMFPDWSYLLFKSNIAKTKFFYDNGTDKGDGVSPQQLLWMTQTIKSIEPNVPCDCGATAAIWKAFYQHDNKNWNLFCSKSYSDNMYIAVIDKQYASMAFNCVYNIYVGYSTA